jgi:hypothetical protein
MMQRTLKVSSDGGDFGSKNCKRAVMVPLVCLHLVSGCQIYVGAFGKNVASVAIKMFLHLIYFIKKFYKRCTSVYYASDRVTVRKRVHSRQLQRVILR